MFGLRRNIGVSLFLILVFITFCAVSTYVHLFFFRPFFVSLLLISYVGTVNCNDEYIIAH
jgi:hypothetical protein